jgi:hypothetical protein
MPDAQENPRYLKFNNIPDLNSHIDVCDIDLTSLCVSRSGNTDPEVMDWQNLAHTLAHVLHSHKQTTQISPHVQKKLAQLHQSCIVPTYLRAHTGSYNISTAAA